ncbi:dihydrolipoamide acetyltransferase family protein [Vallicoccus soli]|uniref:Dihydrolipoamide acetyltransferase component of pyruvate dehydrogenase complex n=1 Tax=Vallicoccus soli TaxID=2339232 RepID=A0A3A3YVH1_9ACTN|nr:dihydrolipoamide acetyltransferase family protein [Vallicoccus soli]RJK94224.1 2-oxo acid dehydrogenase subunit E2 [Vallicoccus soli]
MPEIKQFRLPDVGEGLTEAEIVSWKVKEGDAVAVNDVIVEIETAKSLVELPCPYAGVVAELLVPEGTTADVGAPIIAVDVAVGASAPPVQATSSLAEDLVPTPPPVTEEAPARQPVLVGYGPRAAATARRPRRGRPDPSGAAPVQQALHGAFVPSPSPAPAQAPGPVPAAVLAKPPVRRLAKELGVDLATVDPTGPGRVVTRADVEAAAAAAAPGRDHAAPGRDHADPGRDHAVPGRDHAPAGAVRIPVKGVRKATARAMVASAFTAPHVTEWVEVDVTRTLKLVRRLKEDPALAGLRVGPLLLVARAFVLALRRHPEANASWDEDAQEIVLHPAVHLGIAAATPRGLVVPNVKGADALALPDLARALDELVRTARAGRTQPADLQGGTATITNVGVFGVDGGTPILNPGESVILAVGAVREKPWVHKGRVRPRSVLQLSLSFDHRLVDGELGSKLLADVARVLEDPSYALAL